MTRRRRGRRRPRRRPGGPPGGWAHSLAGCHSASTSTSSSRLGNNTGAAGRGPGAGPHWQAVATSSKSQFKWPGTTLSTKVSSLPSTGRAVLAPGLVDRAREARGPLTLRGLIFGADDEGRGLGLKRSNRDEHWQPKSYPMIPMYWWVPTDIWSKSPVGIQKGNILPKMGSVSFSMSDSTT